MFSLLPTIFSILVWDLEYREEKCLKSDLSFNLLKQQLHWIVLVISVLFGFKNRFDVWPLWSLHDSPEGHARFDFLKSSAVDSDWPPGGVSSCRTLVR